jgi:hypothetical protein
MVVQSGSVHGMQLPALQLDPFAQVPQAMLSPQPSGAVPQVLPWQGFALGTQHLSVWHLSFAAQVSGQVMVPPQPSGAVPQASMLHACAGVCGRQHAFV